jgi:pimeloyl-ACP methyl ester carboxylesterase
MTTLTEPAVAPTPRLDYFRCPHPDSVRGGGHRVAYWEWGDPENPRVLVCVHGLSRQGRDFDVLAQAMAAHYRVICPDLAGRGESDWLADPLSYQVPTYAGEMLALMHHLRLTQVDWVGTSLGGLVGLVVASQPHAPVGRLVLNDVGPVLEPAALVRIGAYVGQSRQWPTLAEAADALWQSSTTFGAHTPAQWRALSRHMVRWKGDAWGLHYDPAIGSTFKTAAASVEAAAAAQEALWQAYDSLRCPTLLLRGQDSDLLSSQTALAMTQRGPKARLHEFLGVGHAPTLVQDDQVRVVQEFLLA